MRGIGIGAAGLVLLAAFAAIERRAPRPLLVPAVWRVPALAPGAVAMVVAAAIAGGLAALALVAAPVVRPAAGERVAVH